MFKKQFLSSSQIHGREGGDKINILMRSIHIFLGGYLYIDKTEQSLIVLILHSILQIRMNYFPSWTMRIISMNFMET